MYFSELIPLRPSVGISSHRTAFSKGWEVRLILNNIPYFLSMSGVCCYH